ncbi:MAG: calcium-binding protein [Inquilinus sp.]|uniref:calcium-binding protein n=1 Tax=Inquilinus sp. TaxID=1932117 RepID=UPI003F2A6F53
MPDPATLRLFVRFCREEIYMPTIDGTPGHDTLLGTAENDIINGLDGYDTLYGGDGNDTLNGMDGGDRLTGGQGADVLNGGNGGDTADYQTSPGAVTVDLAAGTGSGGDAEGDTLIGISGVMGSDFADHLYGDAGANVLSGGGGDDVLWGGPGADLFWGSGGTDFVSYQGSPAAVRIDLSGFHIWADGGDAYGDDFSAINLQNLLGSSHNDFLKGSDQANILQGAAGKDSIIGLGGNDTLEGGDGSDGLDGGAGADVLRGGAGADGLGGGDGSDTASYWYSSVGVTVDLATGTGHGGDAEGDTLSDFEILSGSQSDDHLSGDALANTLQGWNGNDVLAGGAGKDVLAGGAGADRFAFMTTGDSLTGANADRISDFTHAQGDKIDLSAIDANTGAAGDQAFTFISTGLYTGQAGQLRFVSDGTVTTIAGDTNGDGVSDFHIQLAGSIGVVAGDFVL